MFSKEASKQLRQDFWISFGKSYPRKWILYRTKTKGLAFKFHFDTQKAFVSLDIETSNLANRIAIWEKLTSLKSILVNEYLPDAIFEDTFFLENQKEISRIYILKEEVSIHNKDTWRETMEFLNETMHAFEQFYIEYREIIVS